MIRSELEPGEYFYFNDGQYDIDSDDNEYMALAMGPCLACNPAEASYFQVNIDTGVVCRCVGSLPVYTDD